MAQLSIPSPAMRSLAFAVMASLVAVGVVAPVPAAALHISCGDRLTTDTTLDGDLIGCPGNGLEIGAGITLDLNGHTVSGSGTGAGIVIEPGVRSASVLDGEVRDFGVGVAVNSAPRTRISAVTARDNADAGIHAINSDRVVIDFAQLTDNGSFGVLLESSPRSTIRRSEVSGHKVAGVWVIGSPRTVVQLSDVAGNTGSGIVLQDSAFSGLTLNGANGNSQFGIVVSLSDRAQLIENVAGDNELGGILILNTSRTFLLGNIANKNGHFGFQVVGEMQEDRRGQLFSTSGRNRLTANTAEQNGMTEEDLGGIGFLLTNTTSTLLADNEAAQNEAGIRLVARNQDVRVRSNRLHDNEVGFEVRGEADAYVDKNDIHHNGIGAFFHGNIIDEAAPPGDEDNEMFLEFNRFNDNATDGALVGSPAIAKGWTYYFSDNDASGNGDDGIDTSDERTRIHFNDAHNNGDFGLVASTPILSSGENFASGNGQPTQCLNVACTTP